MINDLIEVPISQDPITGLFRKASIREFNWNRDSKNMTLIVSVNFYETSASTTPISTNRIKEYTVRLVVSNSTLVDENGDRVEPDTEGAIGEYDFYIETAKQNISIFYLMEVALVKADLPGSKRYDT